MTHEAREPVDIFREWHTAAAETLPGLSTVLYDRDFKVVLSQGDPIRSPGIEPEELTGKQLADVLPFDIWSRLADDLQGAMEGKTAIYELPITDGDSLFWVQITPLRKGDHIIGGVFTSHEVAQRLEAENELLELTGSFETAFTKAPIGMGLVALDGTFIRVNPAFCRILGYTPEEMANVTYNEMIRPQDTEGDLMYVGRMIAGEFDSFTKERLLLGKSGEAIWVNLASTLVRDDSGQPMHIIAQAQDISERKRLEEELRRIAEEDPLTGLANRRRFVTTLDHQIERCRRYGEKAALLMADLDNFKAINDTWGHTTGDELLVHFGRVLAGRIRVNDLAARLGGDEFMIILVGADAEGAANFASKLMEHFDTHPFESQGAQLSCRASIGSTGIDAHTISTDQAMSAADRAMYEVKAGRKSR